MKTQQTKGTLGVVLVLAAAVGLTSACGGDEGVCIDRDGTTVCVQQSALEDSAFCERFDSNYFVCGVSNKLELQTHQYNKVLPVPAICKQCLGQGDLSQAHLSQPCQSCFDHIALAYEPRMATPPAQLSTDAIDTHHSCTAAAAPKLATEQHRGHHVAIAGTKHFCPICGAHVVSKAKSPVIAKPDEFTKAITKADPPSAATPDGLAK